MTDTEPYIARAIEKRYGRTWGYVLSWSVPLALLSMQKVPEYVVVTRCFTTNALHCHACDRSGRDPCSHIKDVVAHVHQRKGS